MITKECFGSSPEESPVSVSRGYSRDPHYESHRVGKLGDSHKTCSQTRYSSGTVPESRDLECGRGSHSFGFPLDSQGSRFSGESPYMPVEKVSSGDIMNSRVKAVIGVLPRPEEKTDPSLVTPPAK